MMIISLIICTIILCLVIMVCAAMIDNNLDNIKSQLQFLSKDQLIDIPKYLKVNNTKAVNIQYVDEYVTKMSKMSDKEKRFKNKVERLDSELFEEAKTEVFSRPELTEEDFKFYNSELKEELVKG